MAYAQIETWQPYKKTAEILDRAYEHIQSVSYKVSVRWVFYRLLQDGYYNKKSDYNNFVSLTSRARHAEYNGWHPLLLADETRAMVSFETEGERPDPPNMEDLIERAKLAAGSELEEARTAFQDYQYYSYYPIDPNYKHDYILLIMYEARAMSQQFQTYTNGITLCPFGGQPSIPYKYQIAKFIEHLYERYEKEVIVLYFGDLDDAGLTIYETGEADIAKWCNVPIKFTRCGLNQEHVDKYGIPENFEHPGYQWEALTDPQAREIIAEGIGEYYNYEAVKEARQEQRRIENILQDEANAYVDELRENES